jgi:hypothetical protein
VGLRLLQVAEVLRVPRVGGDQVSQAELRLLMQPHEQGVALRRRRPDQSSGIATRCSPAMPDSRRRHRRRPGQSGGIARWDSDLSGRIGPGDCRGGGQLPPRLAVGVSGSWLAAFSGAGSYRRHTGSTDCRSPERNAPAAGREGRRLSPPAGPGCASSEGVIARWQWSGS